VRAVQDPSGSVTPPIFPSTTYLRGPLGDYPAGRSYTRADNPTYLEPERLLAELEGGAGAALFASGLAAATAVFCALDPGDHVVVPTVMYWGLRRWLLGPGVRWGLEVTAADATDPAAVAAAVRPGRTRLVWAETPANPTWEVADLAALADVAHRGGAVLAVDSTVATPVLTRPVEHGADLVVHSATKYLNGHSDVLAGAVVTARDDEHWARILDWRQEAGGVPGPFEAWLLLRGMRTLFLRVRRASSSALHVAEALRGHPAVREVLYPGLREHPGHAIAARQMDGGFGGMLSVRVRGDEATAMRVAAALEAFTRATPLGGVESLVEHRASVEGPESGVPVDLLRLSIGIEHPDDLVADLWQALDRCTG
jgi:cystathionine gamma-synthase